MISFGLLDVDTEAAALMHASATQFGLEGYQHLPAYLDWLYRANPVARDSRNCMVARQDGVLVGAMHRMILPLTGAPEGNRLAVLHNHFVTDAVRTGAGVLLLRRAVKDVAAGFAPGVQTPLDEVYRRLGFAEVRGSWLVRPLARIKGALQMIGSRWREAPPLRVDLARLKTQFADLTIAAEPDDEAIATLCSAMRRSPVGDATSSARVDWSPALVRWRYFHPTGPRHLWIAAGGSDLEWAVVSFGRRRGVGVARLLELAPNASAAFVARAMRVARAAGASLALCFATDPAMVTLLTGTGWRMRNNGTFSFATAGTSLALGAGASDVGFEAIRTVIA